MSDNTNNGKSTNTEEEKKDSVVILGRTLSDNAAEIYNDFSKTD